MAQSLLERELEQKMLKLDCLIEIKPAEQKTGIEFRDCIIDYTRCPNQRCIKKLQ